MKSKVATHILQLDAACAAAQALIKHSAWFELTPLPDGEYEIRCKDESANQELMADICAKHELAVTPPTLGMNAGYA